MEEWQEACKLQKADYVKNLYYVDKKKNYYMVVAKWDTKVEKNFWKNLNIAPGNIRLCPEDALKENINCVKGEVSPFSLTFDTEKKTKMLIFDKKLEDLDFWCFHPINNTATVELSKQDMCEKFLKTLDRSIKYVDLETIQEKEDVKPEKKEKKEKKEEEKH